jgi:toxin YoeB
MTYFVELDIDAEKDLKTHIKSGNKILLKRIYKLLKELELHPKTGTGKPHQLKHEKNGIWSRSIDNRHRMLYTIDNEKVTVFVISLYGHYNDK